ncbi:MAG: DJ-1 family glyoxalase III [Lachnospiraceae bacterium]|nr:DJ-1 family glyoxalase III [Lachnospiraceae bacterium]
MSRVLLFLADGFEEVEALTVVDLLRRADIDIKTVSISDSKTVIGRSRITVEADMMQKDASFDDAEMLVLPGGQPGTTYLSRDRHLAKELKKFNEAGKKIAAICAAPTVFGGLGLLEKKRATCYPGCESMLTGAQVVLDEEVVVDGNITTSRGAGTAIPFALSLIGQLVGQDMADQVKRGIVFREV